MIQRKLNTFAASSLVVCLFIATLAPVAAAQRQPRVATASPSSSTRPKLVVILMVDQFRYDLLERFSKLFGDGGFKRLMNGGAFFTNANYDYVPTVTAAGHAAVHTGSVPAMNGIYTNYTTDRDRSGYILINPQTGEPVIDPDTKQPAKNLKRCKEVLKSCRLMAIVDDKATHVVSNKGVEDVMSASPRALLGTTIGDQMRLSTHLQSKVISISQKDRAAVLPGGHFPNGAFWLNLQLGGFITSDYYYWNVPNGLKQLPQWVQEFNKQHRPQPNLKWELSEAARAFTPPEVLDTQNRLLGKDFPYTITGATFDFSPFASDYLEEFAEVEITNEALGKRGFTDLLAISFSAPDLVGHAYGPDSPEIASIYENLDRTVARLLKFIDGWVGSDGALIAVTGDHGVTSIPQLMKKRGYAAEVLKASAVEEAVNHALEDKYKRPGWNATLANDQLFFNHSLMDELKASPAEVERVAADAALKVEGVANCFTRTQIIEGRMPVSEMARRVVNGYDRQHGGDVWLITKPLHFFSEDSALATTHGSPYLYDTHVPVIFYGAGVRRGRYNRKCTPSDIAPTIAAVLGIKAPSTSVGRVLVEALAADAHRRMSGQR